MDGTFVYHSCNPHCDVHESACLHTFEDKTAAPLLLGYFSERKYPTCGVKHKNAHTDSYSHYHCDEHVSDTMSFCGSMMVTLCNKCESKEVTLIGPFASAGERLGVVTPVNLLAMFEGCNVHECAPTVN